MKKSILSATVLLATASQAFAGTVVAVPELSAVGATAAIATVAGAVVLLKERRRNKRD